MLVKIELENQEGQAYEHFITVFLWPGLNFLQQLLSLAGGGGKDGPKGPNGPQGPNDPKGPGRAGEGKGVDFRGKTTNKGLL